MTMGPMISGTQMEKSAGTFVHSDAAGMSLPFLGGEKYFVTFIDEGSGNGRAAHMKSKGVATSLLRRHVNGLSVRQEHQCET